MFEAKLDGLAQGDPEGVIPLSRSEQAVGNNRDTAAIWN
jgi:hypothetical protein